MKNNNPLKIDFSKLHNIILSPGDTDVAPEHLHGTPASVTLPDGQEEYAVISLYYDGDKKGFVVTINNNGLYQEYEPGKYETRRLLLWNDKINKLEVLVLS